MKKIDVNGASSPTKGRKTKGYCSAHSYGSCKCLDLLEILNEKNKSKAIKTRRPTSL